LPVYPSLAEALAEFMPESGATRWAVPAGRCGTGHDTSRCLPGLQVNSPRHLGTRQDEH